MNRNNIGLLGIGLAVTYFLSKISSWNPVDIVEELPSEPANGVLSSRQLSQIDTIVVHHSAVPSTAGGATPQGYNTFHQISPYYRYPRIAYHIVIQPDGFAYLTNYLETISYHVGTLNPSAVGVVLSGNFDNEPFTKTQQETLEKVLAWIQRKVGKKLKIHGHYRYSSKTCPGMNVRNELPSIIQKVGGKA